MFSLLKIPFDCGNMKMRGSALAPELIARDFPDLKKIDVIVNLGNFEETQENIFTAALKELEDGKRTLGIGGDHSVTYGLVKAASQKFKNLGLVYFDAHLDCEDDFLPPSHEDVIKAIVNEGLVAANRILIIGARKSWPKERAFVRKKKISVFNPKQKKEAMAALKKLSDEVEHLYVSVDIDVFEPEIAPATVYREKNGLNFENFRDFTTVLNFKRIIGLDLVEVSPQLDLHGKTITLASDVIKLFISQK